MDQSHERTGHSVNFQSKTAKYEEETISCLDYIYVDSIINKLQKVVSIVGQNLHRYLVRRFATYHMVTGGAGV